MRDRSKSYPTPSPLQNALKESYDFLYNAQIEAINLGRAIGTGDRETIKAVLIDQRDRAKLCPLTKEEIAEIEIEAGKLSRIVNK